MARVEIIVEREGGSRITIEEQSVMPLFTDDQCALLVQEAFVRTLRALGVQSRPDPEPSPPAPAASRPEQVLSAAQAQRVDERADAARKAA